MSSVLDGVSYPLHPLSQRYSTFHYTVFPSLVHGKSCTVEKRIDIPLFSLVTGFFKHHEIHKSLLLYPVYSKLYQAESSTHVTNELYVREHNTTPELQTTRFQNSIFHSRGLSGNYYTGTNFLHSYLIMTAHTQR